MCYQVLKTQPSVLGLDTTNCEFCELLYFTLLYIYPFIFGLQVILAKKIDGKI